VEADRLVGDALPTFRPQLRLHLPAGQSGGVELSARDDAALGGTELADDRRRVAGDLSDVGDVGHGDTLPSRRVPDAAHRLGWGQGTDRAALWIIAGREVITNAGQGPRS
jgi:hypothetical protein